MAKKITSINVPAIPPLPEPKKKKNRIKIPVKYDSGEFY